MVILQIPMIFLSFYKVGIDSQDRATGRMIASGSSFCILGHSLGKNKSKFFLYNSFIVIPIKFGLCEDKSEKSE